MRLNEARKKLGGEEEPKGIGGVRDAKGATALLCANAMCFTTNKRPYQW